MRLPASRGRAIQPGFTLIELLVVLAVMAISFALVAPAVLPAADPPVDPAQQVIDAARRVAVRRAGPVVLRIGTDGHWAVQPVDGAGAPLDGGTLATPPHAPIHLRISAIGACSPARQRDNGPPIDPVRCRILERTELP